MASPTSIGLALQLFIAQDAAPRFVVVPSPFDGVREESTDRRVATPRLGAGGLAVADVDGDGRLDLYVGRAAGRPNRLLIAKGDGSFVERAHDFGLDLLDATCGALFLDLDGDGHEDALVFGDALHALRRAGGRFEPADELGLVVPPGFDGVVTAVAAADVDGDGDRDLFVATARAAGGRLADARPHPLFDAQNGPRHLFFRNDGGKYVESLEEAGLAAGATRLARDARFLDVDGDGDADLVVANDPGLAQLYVNDGKGRFTEVALCDGRDCVGRARFLAWEDLDGDGARDLWVAAPSDPVGEGQLAAAPAWRDGLAPRVQRDALAGTAGGFALACGAGGRREISATLGLAHLGSFTAGVVADFGGGAAPEIVLFGGERDDLAKYWDEVVPAHARLGADPERAAAALAALPPAHDASPDAGAPRLLARGADGAFHVVPAGFPDARELRDPAAVVAFDFEVDGARDLALLGEDGELVLLRDVTRVKDAGSPPPRDLTSHDVFVVRTAVATPAPGGELPTARGGRVRLDVRRERPCLVVRGDVAAIAAEAAPLTDVDVVLLDAANASEPLARARTVFELLSELLTGDRAAATRFRVDRDGWIDLAAGGGPLAALRDLPASAEGRWLGERRRGAADLPRAELAARLPNVAVAAWQKLEAAGVTGFDLDVGLALFETKKAADAEARFAAVPPASPEYPRAQLELARLLERAKRDADARAAYGRAIAAAPTDGTAYYESGRLLLKARDSESEAAGIEALRFATYLRPEWEEAQLTFGGALLRVSRLDEASEAFARVVALDDASATGHLELAGVLHRLHRDGEAMAHAERAVQLAPESAAAGKLLEALRSKKND